jgi:hypothetical protein
MKKYFVILAMVVLYCNNLFSDGWNDSVATTLSTTNSPNLETFANRYGIHTVWLEGSDLKYALLNTSGGVVRQSTIDYD